MRHAEPGPVGGSRRAAGSFSAEHLVKTN